MNLLELQRQMFEDVRRPLTSDFAMQQKTEDGRSISELAESYIKPNDRLTSFERLEIYNRQYWFRTIAAVSEDFPALAAVLGSKRVSDATPRTRLKAERFDVTSTMSGR
jgi:Putative DNA-binding domain